MTPTLSTPRRVNNSALCFFLQLYQVHASSKITQFACVAKFFPTSKTAHEVFPLNISQSSKSKVQNQEKSSFLSLNKKEISTDNSPQAEFVFHASFPILTELDHSSYFLLHVFLDGIYLNFAFSLYGSIFSSTQSDLFDRDFHTFVRSPIHKSDTGVLQEILYFSLKDQP